MPFPSVMYFRFRKGQVMVQGIVMFSGGLDSVCATHLLLSQGLKLKALYFMLPFYAGLGIGCRDVKSAADKLGVPLQIIEEGEEYLPVVKNPVFGFGKNANPCIDCRIHRLKTAKKIMEVEGASFIATGEVVGQRPMSQRMDCLHKIENHAALKGYLLRPLCAKLLPPTIAEQKGVIDRGKLLSISGRGRKEQIAYAQKFGLVHGTPAGGCLLTNEKTADRFNDLVRYKLDFDLEDFKLLAWGRHFRLSPSIKLIVGRDDTDNRALEKIASADDGVLYMPDAVPGPFGILRGSPIQDHAAKSASLFCRHTKFRNEKNCRVVFKYAEKEEVLDALPATEEECDRLRI
jgi:tRNA-uridine 2-sulfurtransferase